MNILEIDWLMSCPKCDCFELNVETDSDDKNMLFSGDKIICPECGEIGYVEADGVDAWAEWGGDL